MIKRTIADLIYCAVINAQEAGDLPQFRVNIPDKIPPLSEKEKKRVESFPEFDIVVTGFVTYEDMEKNDAHYTT